MKFLALLFSFSLTSFGATTGSPYTSLPVMVYPTIASMVSNGVPNLAISGVYQTVEVQGWSTPGDLGGGKFTLTNSVVKTNTATLIYSGKTGYSWRRIDDGPPSAKWWGIKGNLDAGDAAKCDLMLLDIGTNGGAIKWPVGRYKINALIPSGVGFDCEGSSIRADAPLGTHAQTANGVCFFSADLTKPAIKFGSSWGAPTPGVYVRNSWVRNATIMGSLSTTNNFGDCAVFFAGGSQFCFLENCNVGFAKHAVREMAEVDSEVYANSLIRCTITMPSFMTDSSSNDFRGLYVSAPRSGTVAGFNTSFKLEDNCNIEGGPYGYNIEVDGCELYLNDTYSDSFDSSFVRSHSVLMNHTVTTAFSADPLIHGGYLDGGGIQIVVNFDNGVGPLRNTISYVADGTTAAGDVLFWDGSLLPFESGTAGAGSQYFTYTYPVFFGAAIFRPPGNYTAASAGTFPSISVGSSRGFTVLGYDKFAVFTGAGTGIQNVSTTPRIDLTMSTSPFANSTLVGSLTNVTLSPPSSTGSVILTGAGVNASGAGLLTSPNMLTPGNFSIGGSILGLSSNIIVLATNQLQVYSTNGILTASPTQPALYLFQQITNSAATNPLASIYSITTNLHLHPAVSDSGSVVIGGIGLNATAAGVITAPGWFSSKTGFVLNSTNPTSGHVLRSDGVTFTDGVLTVADIGAGILPDSQLSTNIPRLNGTNVFSGTNTFMGTSIITNVNNTLAGNGAKITSINATNVTAGLFATNILGSGVALNNTFLAGDLVWRAGGGDVYQIGTNVFSGTNSFSGITLITNAANVFTGTGAGLTALNASSLASGTVGTARLGTGLANNATILYGDGTWKPLGGGGGDVFQVGTNRFTGTNSFSGITLATNNNNLIWGTFQGVGTGLGNLNASSIDRGMVASFYLGTGTPTASTYLAGDNSWKSLLSPAFYIFTTSTLLTTYQDMATNLVPVTYLPDIANESLEAWATGYVQSDTGAGVRTSIRFVFGDGPSGTAANTIPITLGDTLVHRYFVTWKIYRGSISTFNSIVDFHSDGYSVVSQSTGFAGSAGVAQLAKIQGLTVGTATMDCEFAKINLMH